MYGPVRPLRFAVLARAVERVDDPHPPVAQPSPVVGRLLGEHGVVGPCFGEGAGEELVGQAIAGVAQVVEPVGGIAELEPVPFQKRHQEHPGLCRQLGRQPVVVGIGPGAIGARTAVGGHALTLTTRALLGWQVA